MIDSEGMEKRSLRLSKEMEDLSQFLTTKEAAKYTGLSVHTLRLHKEKFYHIQFSGKYGSLLFLKSGLDDYLDKKMFKPKAKKNA